jgi:hypothetical protein
MMGSHESSLSFLLVTSAQLLAACLWFPMVGYVHHSCKNYKSWAVPLH